MDTAGHAFAGAHDLYARSGGPATSGEKPPVYKVVGLSLAIGSGLLIGASFVLKKMGLLKANVKYDEAAGEGYGYLKNAWWWTGMTMMIVGEICNFVAYAFVDAILVTPLGALSVVVCTILSAIFLKERLSFVGKVGCFMCIVGSVVIVLNAPTQSAVKDIQDMKNYVRQPGFLSYAGVVIVACTFIALWAGPRYGKSSMLVYLSICSLIGGLSVVATQGLGSAIVAQARGESQFKEWFLYVLLVFVITTLVTEIIYLNKALNIFNAALVTPTYYVFFTSSTIVTSAVLFRGFKGSPISIATVVMGFLQICAGVILLQLSKSAKDVPDTAIFSGDLDQVRTVAEQEQSETEPKADAIRGTAALIRRISVSRQKMEAVEAERIQEEKKADLQAIGEDEVYEWDGIRRRRTTVNSSSSIRRRKTLHPPLGLTKFPDMPSDSELPTHTHHSVPNHDPSSPLAAHHSSSMVTPSRSRAKSAWLPGQRKNLGGGTPQGSPHLSDIPLTSQPHYPHDGQSSLGLPPGLQPPVQYHSNGGSSRVSPKHSVSPTPLRWADDIQPRASVSQPNLTVPESEATPPPGGSGTKRTFSFQNMFSRNREHGRGHRGSDGSSEAARPTSRRLGSSRGTPLPTVSATEEESLGLVKGDSRPMLPLPDYGSDSDAPMTPTDSEKKGAEPLVSAARVKTEQSEGDREKSEYEERKKRWEKERDGESTEIEPRRRLQVPDTKKEGGREKSPDGKSDGGPAFI
ncbi:MAG: hypothetical protein M1814_002673 [Vezdaea aestivalis]|nr:MAG: hypothetical protein M1814_002673 [Vezdaea aestivalis]